MYENVERKGEIGLNKGFLIFPERHFFVSICFSFFSATSVSVVYEVV